MSQRFSLILRKQLLPFKERERERREREREREENIPDIQTLPTCKLVYAK
jgi:hypothetical protein